MQNYSIIVFVGAVVYLRLFTCQRPLGVLPIDLALVEENRQHGREIGE